MTYHGQSSVPLSESSLGEAVSLLSHAFKETPSYQEIAADPKRTQSFLAWLFERDLWLKLRTGAPRCVFESTSGGGGGGGGEEGQKLVMFFSLEKPGARQVTTWDMLRAGLLLGVLVHGLAITRRLVQTKAWFEERESALLGERAGSVARLERVAVLPSRQGRGVGSAALASAPYPYPNPNANPARQPHP